MDDIIRFLNNIGKISPTRNISFSNISQCQVHGFRINSVARACYFYFRNILLIFLQLRYF